MKDFLKKVVIWFLRSRHLRINKTKMYRAQITEAELIAAKKELNFQFVNFDREGERDASHVLEAEKCFHAYEVAINTSHDDVFDASSVWQNVYADSKGFEKNRFVNDLFYGCRTHWLEDNDPSVVLLSFNYLPHLYEETIYSFITGRNLLEKNADKETVELLNDMFWPGQPLSFSIRGRRYSNQSRFWYHLCRMKPYFAGSKVFMDLGAGTGDLAFTIKKTIPEATVICADLPETLVGASYRLARYFGGRCWRYGDGEIQNVRDYDFIFIPGYALNELPDLCIDFVTNINSLSEMRPDTITSYLKEISRLLCQKGRFYSCNRNYAKKQGGLRDHWIDIPESAFAIPKNLKVLAYQKHLEDLGEFFPLGTPYTAETIFEKISVGS